MNKYNRFLFVSIIMLCCIFTGSNLPLKPVPNEIDPAMLLKGGACSSICLMNNDYPIFGTNMDTHKLEDGIVVINKRGLVKTGVHAGTTGKVAQWKSKYASITFSLVSFEMTWAGMNEKGLVISTMGLYDHTVSPPPDERPYLGSEWLQYILDTCETIEEVITAHSRVRIITVDHYLLADRHGNRAVLEFLRSGMKVYTGKDLPVAALTNSPYKDVLRAWLEDWQSDQSYGPYRRFCTAADSVDSFQSSEIETAVQYAFDTLYSIRSERFYPTGLTQWSIVFDLKNYRAYFRTASFPEIRYVDLNKFDLSCQTGTKMLNIQADWTGDVADNFTEFSYDLSFFVYKNFITKWGNNTSDEWIHYWIRHCLSFPCVD